MAKRRRKPRRRRKQSSTDLRQNGLNAFKRGDYNQAIETWERATRQTPHTPPTSALAEAYFRRGMKCLYGTPSSPLAGLNDLEQAAKLRSDDPRYAYHLGLAAHRQGKLDWAIRQYRMARTVAGEFANRAAYPLALALLQRGDDPTADRVWSALPIEERAMLSQTRAFQRRPYTLSPDAPLLWQALAALDAGKREQALAALDSVLKSPASPTEQGMAHYYRGVLAARDEDWDKARQQWNAARATGLQMPHLADNLAETYHQLAEERLVSGDVEGALAAAEEAARHNPGDKRLNALLSQAHQRLAYQAASSGRWTAAHSHWEAASAAGGSSFRLAYNMALAYERAEDFLSAGQAWRAALRCRPRRDDHPDAINDEQVARLWQRSAEAYRKAGEHDEAVHVYRQAVKWNPDNLETRLALSEALMANGQIWAAENELDRILERDPDHIPALLRQGEVIAASGSWWTWKSPTSCWERVLALEPDNGTARQLLADFYQNEAEARLSWGHYTLAIERYQQALEYQPRNAQILAALGGCYLRMGDESAAQSHFGQALAHEPDDLVVYDKIIHAWFDVDEPGLAWSVLERAEAAIATIPYEFYMSQAAYCIADYQSEVVSPWLERAVEKAPPDVPLFAAIGEMAVMAGDFDIGREYLEQAIEAKQQPGQVHLMLGILAAKEGDNRAAERHWKEAERIARRDRDRELSERIEMTRFISTAPPEMVNLILGLGRGPSGSIPFPDFFDDEYDDDDDVYY